MSHVHQHTPPGGWPHGKGKDAPDHSPPEYFEGDNPTDNKDTKKATKDKPLPSVEADDSPKKAKKAASKSTKKPIQLEDNEADEGDDETNNPLEELQGGLKAGQEAPSTDKLDESDWVELSEEEKKKLTVGGGLDSIGAGDAAKKGDDATKTADDATKTADDTTKDVDAPAEAEGAVDKATDAPKEAEEATKDADVPKEGEEAVEGATDKAGEATDAAEDATKDVDAPKEAEEAAEGVEAPKEGEEAVEGATDKVGETTDAAEDATKDAEVPKEGEEALKEGEDAVKEGEAAAEDAAEEPLDLSILKGGKVNKGGNVVDEDGKVVGRIKEGVLAHLVGKRVDENGDIWNDSGKKIGSAELIPENEREALIKEAAPFEAFPDAKVDGEGYVITGEGGERVGKVVEGDIKKLRGMAVDADGDILDRGGNVVGKAERWEPEAEPEPEPEAEVDRSILAGKRVNKAGNVVDSAGTIFGRVVEGDPKRMIGRMCNKQGEILSESGDVIGRAEVVPEGEREGQKEGPFAELSGCTVAKDGKVVTPGGDVVGRLIKGDPKVLFGRLVDDDGDIVDKNGNILGKAERWEEPEVEKKKNPLTGRKVNREGNVVDEDGNIIGKLTSGDLSICQGKEIDEDGDVVDGKGTTIGHVSLLEDIKQDEETPEDKELREKAASDKKLAIQMAYCLTQVLDKVKPICTMITQKIEAAERKPKEELDEEELVKEVRPLIEEGGKILQEANGIIRGLDPDGRIQANAKHKTATHEATPEEYRLADILKELTGTVTKTIEDAKKKLEGMPHAKKELSPLWGLLSEPLFQILAAVGLLLNGVLGLVGRLLSGLGLGGIVDSLLGGLGVKNILEALGIGSLTDSLTGKNQKGGKKKGGGGLLGLGG